MKWFQDMIELSISRTNGFNDLNTNYCRSKIRN